LSNKNINMKYGTGVCAIYRALLNMAISLNK